MGMGMGMHLQVCFSLPNPNPYSLLLTKTITKPYYPSFFSFAFSFPKGFTPKPKPNPNPQTKQTLCSKRTLNLSFLALFLNVNGSLPAQGLMEPELELERYTDSKEGFTLLRPSSYVRVEKAGATVLFEEFNRGSNNVGVVVNPVRLTTLADFGTPQFVANKLIQAEKRKESTKDAEVIGVAERSGHGGLQVYEFEYTVDSTRGGMKRIFSAAFVISKKLYLLNIAHSDKPESPLGPHTRMLLEKVLHSFDAASIT